MGAPDGNGSRIGVRRPHRRRTPRPREGRGLRPSGAGGHHAPRMDALRYRHPEHDGKIRAIAGCNDAQGTAVQKGQEGRDEEILAPEIEILDGHHHLFDRPHLRYMIEDYLGDVNAGHKILGSVYIETPAFARPDARRTGGVASPRLG